MKTDFRFSSVLLIALAGTAGSLMAHAADSGDTNAPVSYVMGSEITGKIKAKLAEDQMGSLLHISVNTDDHGGVELTGNAPSQEDADRAVATARSTPGVTGVSSEITIAN